jgi:uncharacterized membrane protein
VSHDLLDLTATPERLRALAEAGVLTPQGLKRALRLAVATPERPAWRRFLSAVLLGFGSLLVLSGVIYFFAYNWAALHRFGKMGLLLAALLAACVAAWRLGERLAGQFALLFAAVLVGPLLAVYGQAYQTGADPYELFLGWSLLVLPWVALARFAPLWLLLLLLVDTGLCLFGLQVADGKGTSLLLVLGLVNGGAWGVHEFLASRGHPWLRGRWLPRVLAMMTLAPLLALAEYLVAVPREADTASRVGLGLLVGVMAAVYFFHRQVRSELFLLTLSAVSVMTLVTTFVGRLLFKSSNNNAGSFFVMALLIIGEVGLTVWWLRAEARGPEET